VTEDELISLLTEDHPKWSLPDRIEFVDEIPYTATGKALKMEPARAVQRLPAREELG
jgi:acyl-CoA synthetase (AMP-forming)/AMP-acid ligase II